MRYREKRIRVRILVNLFFFVFLWAVTIHFTTIIFEAKGLCIHITTSCLVGFDKEQDVMYACNYINRACTVQISIMHPLSIT